MAMRRASAALALAALAAPLGALVMFRMAPSTDPMLMQMDVHFWIVGGTALAAALACATIMVISRTLRETRLQFLSLAFLCIAGIFSIHGLATPGYILDKYYASVSVSSWVSVLAGAIFVALSAASLPTSVTRLLERARAAISVSVVAGVAAYIVLSLTAAHWLDHVPTDRRGVQYSIALASLTLFGFAIWRYGQAYLFARLPSQAAMVVALALLAEVQVVLLWGRVWHISWWTYHALYAVAFVVLFAGWVIEARRAGTTRAIADALSMRDALAQLNRGRNAQIVALVDAIEAKDIATHGHVNRVSSYALAIGRKLALPAHELRDLVLAAQMHDVGKIAVPEAILRKPGPLTADEFTQVKRHAERGHEIARRVEALRPLAAIIRAHHERLQGQGYPDGLAGEAIPLLARIIAVADTYDAMTSSRPYRSTRTHALAVAELRRVSGIELDPRCVEAFLASFAQEGLAAAA